MKRKLFIFIVTVISIISVNSQNLEKIKIGYTGKLSEEPLFIAKEFGLFTKEGIEAEFIKLDYDKIKDAFNTKTIDAAAVNPLNFKDFQNINITESVTSLSLNVYSASKSKVKAVKDLKGKTIAFDKANEYYKAIFAVELSKAGIDPLSGVKWIGYDFDKIKTSVKDIKTDAFLVSNLDFLEINDRSGYDKLLNSTFDLPYAANLTNFLAFRKEIIDKKPDLVKNTIIGLIKAKAWINGNTAVSARQVNKKYLSKDIVDDYIIKTLKLFPNKDKELENLKKFYKEAQLFSLFNKNTSIDNYIENINYEIKKDKIDGKSYILTDEGAVYCCDNE